MNMWTLGWILWIAMFFAIEMPAVFNKEKGDTLSEHIQKLFFTRQTWGRFAWFLAFGFFAAWFAWHIAGDFAVGT